MSVYRVIVKKQVRWHKWTNTYIIVTHAPYSLDELLIIADTVAPRLVRFEQHFHSKEVDITETISTPILDPPVTNIFAQRPANPDSPLEQSVAGLRPIAIDDGFGPMLTLMLGLQPVCNHWGSKDYRYALSRDEVKATANGYQLQPESYKVLQKVLESAKKELFPLLQASPKIPSLALAASQDAHNPQIYRYRYVKDIIIKGAHMVKHRRR